MIGTGISLSLLFIFGVIAAAVLAGWLALKACKAVFFLIDRVIRFVGIEVGDSVRLASSLVAMVVFVPTVLLKVITGQWSSVRHYGKAVETELAAAGKAAYRVAFRNPLWFIGLYGNVQTAVANRVGETIARAPGPDKPAHGFADYGIVGSLPSGGSGAKLFVANPGAAKRKAFLAAGHADPGQVVIKSFRLDDGSNLPQIVRENRALEAARNLGLVLDHGIDDNRFFYVMPYVPGEDLGAVTRRLHAESDGGGLAVAQLHLAMGYVTDLLAQLDRYHAGGLWHKDVKPDNIIVSGNHAYLVDLGLVTPLRSAMTLTTHGTEYYRDPELVREALRGAKVHEIDGVAFDLYGTGAVLFSIVENGFPAHGSLSQVTSRCPDAMRWIIRRAMADLSGRYRSAGEMLADLQVLRQAPDPYVVKPADLPSMGGLAVAQPAAPLPPAPAPLFTPVGNAGIQADEAPRRPASAVMAMAAAPWCRRKRAAKAAMAAGADAPGFSKAGGSKPYRSGPNFGALTALLIAVFIGSFLFLAVFQSARMGHGVVVSSSGMRIDIPRVPSEIKHAIAGGMEQMRHSLEGVDAAAFLSDDCEERDFVFERMSVQPDARVANLASNRAPRRLILLEDAPDSDADVLDDLYEQLEDDGLSLLGWRRRGGTREEGELDLLAGARHAARFGSPDDSGARARLHAFLAEHPEVDGVLWIARRNEDGGLRGLLLPAGRVESDKLHGRLSNAVH